MHGFCPPRLLVRIGLSIVVLLLWSTSPGTCEQPIDFNRDIRPLLSDNCFQCHGPDAEHREADLRFDVEESATADLGGYAAIVPGKPSESELVARIITDKDDDARMPPVDSGKELTDQQIKLLTRWVEEGAVWSQHWAYVAPQQWSLPDVSGDWPANWIDRFVFDRLNQEGLSPAPPADRVTLIRRLTFDLTGLPPSPADVEAFVSDKKSDAYERVVDRLLRSSHFGERLAVYWLDLVRYADTVGYHGDQDHNISPYRDYVIAAFNDNMPFDQFTREQLAGDLLPDSTIDQKIATGYNRLLQTTHEGGLQPAEYLAIYAADRVRNVSNVWMGATLGCAQCHDHKYDPYTAKDFYSMSAFFADVDDAAHFKKGTNNLPTARPPELNVLPKTLRKEAGQLKQEIEQLTAKLESTCEAGAKPTLEAKLDKKKQRQQSLDKHLRKTMITKALEKPRETRVFPRGNWLDETGPIVQPAVPEFMGGLANASGRSTRLDLANWFADAEQGAGNLTARVFANRFWYLLFGRGLSPVMDDFGGQGEAPSYPHLLDNLALEFVSSDWDVKHMLKFIVMSNAYQQSSQSSETMRQRDPYNRLVARQARFRLPAEMVRDSALSISGLLVDSTGGDSVKPYQPAGYYRHLNFPQRKYAHHDDDRQWRRGVYMHWQRQYLHPMLKAFDAPSREECTAKRPRSNTPLAALALLNDPTFVEAARVFAARILHEADADFDSRLKFAFQQSVSRNPRESESKLLKQLFEQAQRDYLNDKGAARQLTTVGLAPAAELVPVADLAAWTVVGRAIMNLDETISRN